MLLIELGIAISRTVWENAARPSKVRGCLCVAAPRTSSTTRDAHPQRGTVFITATWPFSPVSRDMLPGMKPSVDKIVFNYRHDQLIERGGLRQSMLRVQRLHR